MHVVQSYNNNIVVVTLNDGQEAVVIGTGIGFGMKPGMLIDEDKIKKIYISQTGSAKLVNASILAKVDPQLLSFSEKALEHVGVSLEIEVSSSLFISFVDHFNSIVTNGSYLEEEHPLRWIVKRVYPDIYELSKQIYQESCCLFNKKFPRSEITAIALHIINGVQKSSMADAMETTRMINEVLRILEYAAIFHLDKQDINYSRFITHLEFLFNRLRSKNKYVGDQFDTSLKDTYKKMFTTFENHDKVLSVLKKLVILIQDKYGTIDESEQVFLLVHLIKLSSY